MARPPDARDALPATDWSRYRDNLARHLIGLARDVQLRLMSHLVEDRGHRDLRPSFGALVRAVARDPLPLSHLARELAISPQAASQLASLAERAGYLTREGGSGDRRMKLARLTPEGERLVRDAVALLDDIEADHRRRLGHADYRRFGAAIGRLARDLELVAPRDGSDARSNAALLPILANHVEQALMRATSARGHAGLKLSHGQVLPLVGPSGARLHQLAALHGVSRQAISAIAQDLESLGYLCRRPDERDGRGVVVRLTGRGTRLISDSVRALDALDADWGDRLGAGELAAFARSARALYGSLGLEAEVLSGAFASDPFDVVLASQSSQSSPRASNDRRSAEAADPMRPARLRRRGARDDLARLAARLRDRLGSHDAARLAAHLTTGC